jgi:hypothetical protein
VIQSIKFLLFIESNKTFFSYYTTSIRVTISNHLFNLSRSNIFLQLLSTCYQIFWRYKSFIILIKLTENSFNIIICILITWMSCHKFNKLFETDLTSLINIEFGHCNIDKTSRWIESILFYSFSEV